MLGLRAVYVHGLVVYDWDHEGRRVAGGGLDLATVVLAFASVSVGFSGRGGDGLEVGEYGVLLGLAGCVRVGGGDAVVLRDEVEGDHVAGLGGDGVGGELEFVVRGDRDGHYGCGGGAGHDEDGGGEDHFE